MKKLLVASLLAAPLMVHEAAAQSRSISGRVLDASSGQGLPGVTVLVKGTTNGASTNADGSYTLNVPADASTLVFSSIGYVTVERPVGNASVINVTLANDTKQLGEVVVTGALGIQRQERQVGYATATLDTKEVTQARVTNVTNGLTGKVSGLQIQTIGSGINPQVRVTLRGTRSLTGNNEALVVIDGNISTNDALQALNPDDIASISVLKGANAAALYGSQASNGALIITTKKGSSTPQVTFSQTSQFESVSFLPDFQTQFGLGANSWNKTRPVFAPNNAVDSNEEYQYNSMENQQFGPRFDGVVRPLGEELADGSVQMLPYSARPNEKRNFFNTGYQMQNSVTFSGGDEKTKFYASYQNVHNKGIIPKDKFDRNTFRLNASHEMGRFTVGSNIAYTIQRIDATSNLTRDQSVYWNWFNTGVQVPLTTYKDWRNNPYANPNGYYNAFYFNPYWVLDNNRTQDRRNTLIGSVDMSYKLTDWLRAQYRIGITSIDQSSMNTQDKFLLTTYTSNNTNKSANTNTAGFVQDIASNQTRLNSDAFLSFDKTFGDVTVQAILGNNVQQYSSRYNFVASTGLSSAGLFNLTNRVGQLSGSDASAKVRSYAFYADATVGFKDFVYLHGSGRYDNVSNLSKENRSFFYPSVDASFIFSNAIPALKDASFLDYGKLRGGVTKVSQINLGGTTSNAFNSSTGVYQSFGAYALEPIFPLGTGYPFGPNASFTAGNTLVDANLGPETTLSYEAGLELSVLKRRVTGAVTYYVQNSKGQTVQSSLSRATGYNFNLLNAGEVQNKGVEVDLNITPVRLDNGFTWTVGGNFNYNANKVISLPNGLTQLALSTGGNAQLYAIPGKPYPILKGSYYSKTSDNRVILAPTKNTYDPAGDPTTYYYPVKAGDLMEFGNTQPKYKYGFNTSLTYKGITLAGQAELRTGYVVYNAIGEDLDFTGSGARSVKYDRQDFVYPNSAIPQTDANGNVTYVPNTDRITPGGAEFWAQNSTWNRTVAENYVTSGKFFKIREVSLAYALPTSLVSSIGFVKGASINFFGRNIFTWVPKENIYTDPEFSFSNSNAIGINTNLQTPPTKFYGATLTATF